MSSYSANLTYPTGKLCSYLHDQAHAGKS